MTGSNSPADNAVNNFLGGDIWLNTKEQYMKVPNTLAGIAESNFHLWLVYIWRAVHKVVQYPCGQCRKQFSFRGDTSKHQRAEHKEVKYPCAKCDYQGTAKGNLGKHQRAVHERVKYPLRQMWIQSNYEEKSDWSPKGSSWRSQKPLR